jgi:hypothetical protein
MLVKVIKIVYPAIEGQNFDFSYYCIENTRAIHLTNNTCPIRKKLTQNLIKRFKKQQSGFSLSAATWDINKNTIEELLLSLVDWINDAVEILSYEI